MFVSFREGKRDPYYSHTIPISSGFENGSGMGCKLTIRRSHVLGGPWKSHWGYDMIWMSKTTILTNYKHWLTLHGKNTSTYIQHSWWLLKKNPRILHFFVDGSLYKIYILFSASFTSSPYPLISGAWRPTANKRIIDCHEASVGCRGAWSPCMCLSRPHEFAKTMLDSYTALHKQK